MAKRPVFVALTEKGKGLVSVEEVEFVWHRGVSVAQKRKNIHALHEAARRKGVSPLEVSTKSESILGRALSAFNLTLKDDSGAYHCVEALFQGSKVFERGGPYNDLYSSSGKNARSDPRLRNSGALKKFRYQSTDWPLKPKTAFYDWLYLNALQQHPDLAPQLLAYDAFTDIEFNPKKSYGTQARSCALYVALLRAGKLKEALVSKEVFLNYVRVAYNAQDQEELRLL